jgi:hypothetical protein
LGWKCDSKLVPPQFRAKEGDRVALWGRWIVDSGHDDFHTEIHPPLLMATARPTRIQQQAKARGGARDATSVQIITRPYLVSQEFGDGGLFEHLIKELASVSTFPPLSFQVEAHPRLLDMPFTRLNIMTFKVRPPTPRAHLGDKLMVEFSFTRRDDSVAIQILKGNDDESVRIVVVLNAAGYVPPPKPGTRTYTVTLDELEKMDKTAGSIYRSVIFLDILASPLAPIILKRGIKSTKYVGPNAPVAAPGKRVALANLRPVHTPVDDSQPFPLFGTVKLEWQRYAAPPPQGPVEAVGR